VNDDAEMVNLVQRHSNVVKIGSWILITLRKERYISATPPPLPTGLGWWIIEYPAGVSEFRVDGRQSGWSQVSEMASKSRLWSAMNSCMAIGLLRVDEQEEAECTFRCENLR
jgi:hypothetical protein